MRAAVDEEDFRRAPLRAYALGRRFAYFCASPRLCGFVLWGRPERDDIARLTRLLEIELDESLPRHASVVDARRVEVAEPSAFAELHGYVERHRRRLTQQVERLAIVRPAGMAGATAAGFFHVTEPPYPTMITVDLKSALEWLDHPGGAWVETLETAVAACIGVSPSLAQLRRFLDAHLDGVSIDRAARALKMSVRSLQRHLGEDGTTFRDEIGLARVRAAQVLLRDSTASITAIAIEVGCATPQAFSTLFRKVVGSSPSEWRARAQGR